MVACLFAGPLLAIVKSYAAVLPPPMPDRDYRIRLLMSVLLAEARGEGPGGVERVAEVIRNRMKKGLHTADEIVLARLQFSCLNGKTGEQLIDEAQGWKITPALHNEAQRCAYRLVFPDSYGRAFGPLPNNTNGATHYHTKDVLPVWAEGYHPCHVFKNHIFYRL